MRRAAPGAPKREAVDAESHGKVTDLAVRAGEIAQRCAALGDRVCQHFLHGAGQTGEAEERGTAAGAARMDAGAPQGFDRVDVADACDQSLVEKEVLERRPPGVEQGRQDLFEIGVERFDAEDGE
jgi:hypothetical protein